MEGIGKTRYREGWGPMAAFHSDALAVFGVTGAYPEDEGTAYLHAA